MKVILLIVLLLIFLSPRGLAEEEAIPPGTSSHPAAGGRAPFTMHLPKALVGKKPPLLVVLHESGFTDQDWAALSTPIAEEGEYALLCPRALELGFGDRDLDRLIRTVEHVKGMLSSGSVHLLGMRDSARQAILYALAKPRTFKSVVALGADVPRVRAPSAASSLRLLVMKQAADRPAAGRESVTRIRGQLEVAEFREMIGKPRQPDPGARRYIAHFLNAAAGRGTAGKDLSFNWRSLDRGLAERARDKGRALVYLYDDSRARHKRTIRIQNEILFDPGVREAAKGFVPIMGHRDQVGKVDPYLKLQSGPALLVLDETGKVVGALQQKISVAALIALLTAR
jgi:hypothetical protein